jgi:hypothetical protein
LATAALATVSAGLLALAAFPRHTDAPRASSTRSSREVSAQPTAVTPSARVFDWLPDDPEPSTKASLIEITREARLEPASMSVRLAPEAGGEPLQPSDPQRSWPGPSSPPQETTQSLQPVPSSSRRNAVPEAALGYAALEGPEALPAAPGIRLGPGPDPAPGAGMAVYDISARTVYMPNGERLEAHSGLRDKLDDPRYVHVRMRGATPPGTYDLRERERPFHGVRALRLNPVGGSAAVHGRAGLLAHTYMLGPKGDSNGCLVFKNYDRFLQAYLRGEVKRLVVVAGRGKDAPPVDKNRVATPEPSPPSPHDG